jgi:hypothetical protein
MLGGAGRLGAVADEDEDADSLMLDATGRSVFSPVSSEKKKGKGKGKGAAAASTRGRGRGRGSGGKGGGKCKKKKKKRRGGMESEVGGWVGGIGIGTAWSCEYE